MLVDVETFLLNAGRYSDTECEVDALEDYEAHASSPAAYYYHAEHLSSEESPAVTVEQTLRRGEATGKDGAK